MSKTFRRAAMSSICMLIVAVMSLTGATYAWFTIGDTATVDGMKMEIVAATGGVEVSGDNGDTWGNVVTLTGADIAKTGINPVSTVDAKQFVKLAAFNSSNTEQINVDTDHTVTVEGSDDKAPENVIIKNLKLRNTGAAGMTIDLRNTFIQDYDADAAGTAKKATSIGKAGRIAIIYGETTYIMDPYFTAAVGDTAAKYEYTEAVEAYRGIVFAAQEDADDVFFTYRQSNNYNVDTNKTAFVELIDPQDATITLPGLDAEGNPQPVDITVVVWLEGQDTDCSNPNAGGAFNVHLQFNRVTAEITLQDNTTKVPGLSSDPAAN